MFSQKKRRKCKKYDAIEGQQMIIGDELFDLFLCQSVGIKLEKGRTVGKMKRRCEFSTFLARGFMQTVSTAKEKTTAKFEQ